MEMPTGYDLIEHSHEFRMHLLKRLAAGLIDAVVIFLPVVLIVYLVGLEPKEMLVGVLSGFGWFFYSAISESRTGTSLGKKTLGLIVVSIDGPMTFSKGVVRNISKMFWYIFLPIDVLVGMAICNDPRQRWVDSIAKTIIIKKEIKGFMPS
ncbi:MAG: RDD family protein [Methanomassiliicoccus sp.]|nr:MAG: RDD family protein [Methanomassiliicoccus sp.]